MIRLQQRRALAFAFQELALHRVYASCFEANLGSRRVLEKAGFALEGVLREAVVRYGQRQNYLNFAILKPEFLGTQALPESGRSG